MNFVASETAWKLASEPGKNLDPSLALQADESPLDGTVLGDEHRPHILLKALDALCLSSFGRFYFVAYLVT